METNPDLMTPNNILFLSYNNRLVYDYLYPQVWAAYRVYLYSQKVSDNDSNSSTSSIVAITVTDQSAIGKSDSNMLSATSAERITNTIPPTANDNTTGPIHTAATTSTASTYYPIMPITVLEVIAEGNDDSDNGNNNDSDDDDDGCDIPADTGSKEKGHNSDPKLSKKEEAKKRRKQAFLKKNSKKDGFARGGGSGR